MTDTAAFTFEIDQNSYLPAGTGRVDAIVTITAAEGVVAPAGRLEMIILDCSSSMAGGRIAAARQAAAAAIAQVPDGVAFTVIRGTSHAQQVHRTSVADDRTRAAATEAVRSLQATGGTAMGEWLKLAGEIADEHEGALRHAILLTDGENGESEPVLQAVLDAVAGRFTCDCRGVGTAWRVAQLRTIASALLGSVDIVADPAGLADDFRAIMGAALGKTMADVALRLWTPQTAQVRFIKQVAPTIEDLTGRGVPAGKRVDYPLGSWGAESRDYHLCVELQPGTPGEPAVAAARVSVVQGDAVAGPGDVLALWTEDTALSTRMSRGVAHYTGQAELAEAIHEGLAAQEAGDERTATARLGRAVELAAEAGNTETEQLLEKVVEIDPKTGTARLRAGVSKADRMTLDSRSTRTVQVRGRS